MTTSETTGTDLSQERSDLVEGLARHRYFLRYAARDLTDEQAGLCPTASQLCVGGLIKHVAAVESNWVGFILGGPAAMANTPDNFAVYQEGFRMLPGETLAGLLERYDEVERRTAEVVRTQDLDASHPLPEAPWFAPGARWSARRALLHILAETAQHAGHADIIRETIDGGKTMG